MNIWGFPKQIKPWTRHSICFWKWETAYTNTSTCREVPEFIALLTLSYDGSTCLLTGENEKFEARFISEDPRGLQKWSVKIEGTDFSKTKEDLIATFASDGYINITEYFDEERIVNKASEGSITYKVYNKGNLIKKYTYKLIP